MTDRFKNWNDYIDPRIKKLTEQNFNLEAFYLFSVTIEYVLQTSVTYQEEWIEKILRKSNLKIKKTKERNIKEKTLGELIGLFAKYCNDENLISKLNEFNSTRRKFIHYLMDHSIDQLNSEAKNKTILYYELISQLSRYNIKILNKLINSTKRSNKKLNQ